MLSIIHKEKSLSTYSKLTNEMFNDGSFLRSVGISVISTASGTHHGIITNYFNEQFKNITNSLTARKIYLNNTVTEELITNSNYRGLRNAGVDLAWKYERADIQMGGNGSANWSYEQKQEILSNGTVRGAEGHHQKNVAEHAELQADPDNIKFYKSRSEHLNEGHGGSWRNESNAELIDKTAMLENTNRRRVISNEVKGVGISAAIGFGIGFTINTVIELAKVGIASADVGEIFANSVVEGVESGLISTFTHGLGRLSTEGFRYLGVDMATKIGSTLNFAAVGLISIAIVSTYQYVKYRINGVENSIALRQVGKQAMFSLSVLTVSIIAQGVYGGCAGIVVSTVAGLMFFSLNVRKIAHGRKIEEKLRTYAIEQYKPLLLSSKGVCKVVI